MLESVERVAHPSNHEEDSVSAMNKDWPEEPRKHQRLALSWVGGSGDYFPSQLILRDPQTAGAARVMAKTYPERKSVPPRTLSEMKKKHQNSPLPPQGYWKNASLAA
ncbi:hypothetical protein LEMLEM_LOCUS13743 [Lemmus lemmus]